jgi:hypothetical protein
MDILTCKTPNIELGKFEFGLTDLHNLLQWLDGIFAMFRLDQIFLGVFIVVGWLYFLFFKILAQHMVSTTKEFNFVDPHIINFLVN